MTHATSLAECASCEHLASSIFHTRISYTQTHSSDIVGRNLTMNSSDYGMSFLQMTEIFSRIKGISAHSADDP